MSNFGLNRTRPVGVFSDHDAVGLIGVEQYSTTSRLVLGRGHDRNFHQQAESPSIVLPLGRKQHLPDVSDVRISEVLGRRLMTYSTETDGRRQLHVAIHEPGEEMDVWDVPSVDRQLTGTGMVVPEYLHGSQYLMFYGDGELRAAYSKNLAAWHTDDRPVASPRHDRFDHLPLSLVSCASVERGLLLLYQTTATRRGQVTISLGGLLCSKSHPDRVTWRSDDPLYTLTVPASHEPRVLGAVVFDHEIVVYLSTTSEKLSTVALPNPFAPHSVAERATKLHRSPRNPVLSPTVYEWESQAVFNPAAIYDNGRVHLLYRAMGPDGVSRIGYASSVDGLHFDERLEYPVYTPSYGCGAPTRNGKPAYDPSAPSGGGWAGCEDPRAVCIDGRAYMSFVAFDGWNFVRMALTSISLGDLRRKDWNWRKPVLISKPGEIKKNWVIFPEKINGKYAILHGLSPKVHIEYVDSLEDFDGQTFMNSLPSHGGGGYHDTSRQDHWDNRVRGAGAPPLKTPIGWLLLYHANDRYDPGKYKLGAMLLDLDDPTKVLYRSTAPLLEPDEWYENDGKPGVVYTCGAVIVGENLIVYYGGGDKHIAVARANIRKFLSALTTGTTVPLEPVSISRHTTKPTPRRRKKRHVHSLS